MAKLIQDSILFVVVFCFLSFPSIIYSEDVPQPPVSQFHIQGQVYCDTCRARFITELSEFIPVKPKFAASIVAKLPYLKVYEVVQHASRDPVGASVRLQCRAKENGDITFTEIGYTRAEGLYSMLVERDHKNEFCEITLISSGRKDCDEIPIEGWVKPSLKFILNTVNGTTRTINPLGFFKKEALPKCAQVYNKLGMYPPDM